MNKLIGAISLHCTIALRNCFQNNLILRKYLIWMRHIIIGALIILLSNSLNAQNKSSYIGLYSGLSIPVGQYKAKNLENGCFTLPGFTIGVEGAWYFKPYLGVGGQFGFNLHPVDVGPLGYEKVISDPFLSDLTIRSDPYQIVTGAVGLFSRWNFWKNLSLHGKLLGGMMWAKTPYQLYKPEYFMVGPEYYEITSSKDNNLMGIIGAGIEIDVSPCIAFRADGEFLYSSMIFGFNTASGIRYEDRTISFINISIALIIIL